MKNQIQFNSHINYNYIINNYNYTTLPKNYNQLISYLKSQISNPKKLKHFTISIFHPHSIYYHQTQQYFLNLIIQHFNSTNHIYLKSQIFKSLQLL